LLEDKAVDPEENETSDQIGNHCLTDRIQRQGPNDHAQYGRGTLPAKQVKKVLLDVCFTNLQSNPPSSLLRGGLLPHLWSKLLTSTQYCRQPGMESSSGSARQQDQEAKPNSQGYTTRTSG